VRVLFDQGTPVPLRQLLTRHEVVTAYERGWSNLNNGELLDAAEKEGFAVLVTTDSNLKCQRFNVSCLSHHRPPYQIQPNQKQHHRQHFQESIFIDVMPQLRPQQHTN